MDAVINACLGCNIFVIRNQLMGMAEKSTFAIDFTHYINKAILCSGSNCISHGVPVVTDKFD
jgi:hypothetical protein